MEPDASRTNEPGIGANTAPASDPHRSSANPHDDSQNRPFLLLRYTLIIATAYLLLVEKEFILPPVGVILLIALALASNVLLAGLGDRVLKLPWLSAVIILFDTAWITAALVQSGRFAPDFFYLYFFVLLLAAIGENLRLIVVGAFVICAAYLYLHTMTGGSWSFWASPSLIRIPFLFSVAASYGYLVDRVRRERERASQADRVKYEFLATLSHELRTPINVVIGYADLLLSDDFGALNDEQSDAVRHIRSAAHNLHRYIVHVLDESRILSRIQTGHDPLTCEEVNLQAVCEDLRDELPKRTGPELRWDVPPDLPPLRTDPEKLHLVLRNLLENAIKYCPKGSIDFTATFDAHRDLIQIRVADTGIGIQADELPHIFEPFYRAQGADQPGIPGIGLGLYLVKQFVDVLGGQIAVASVKDVGTTFSLLLPRNASNGAAHAPPTGAGAAAPPQHTAGLRLQPVARRI